MTFQISNSILGSTPVKSAAALGVLTTNTATQNSTAIRAAFEAMEVAGAGWAIQFDTGVYEFNETVEVTMPCKITGVSGNSHGATIFQFPNNGQDGIRINFYTPVGRKLLIDGGTNVFSIGETVTGAHGSATVYACRGLTGDWGSGTGAGILYLTGVTGYFADNDVLTGSVAGAAVANGADVVSNAFNGAGSELSSFRMHQHGATVGGNAITVLAVSYLHKICVSQWKGNGFNVVASTGDNSNANDFHIQECVAGSCGGHGFYFDGADSNAGNIYSCTATSNTGWGFYDAAFLGNTFIGCEADSNGIGSYKCDDPNARTFFLNCYHEGGAGQGAPDLSGSRAFWLGGLCEVPVIGGQSYQDGYWNVQNIHAWSGGAVNNNNFIRLGSTAGGGQQVYQVLSHAEQYGAQTIQRWDSGGFFEWYDSATGAVGSRQPIYGAAVNGRFAVPSVPQMPTGCYIGEKRVKFADHKPDATDSQADDWVVGDIVYNNAPTPGGNIGWVCTSPGTSSTRSESMTATADGSATVTLSAHSGIFVIKLGSYLTINSTTARVIGINADYQTVGITTLTMSGNIPAGSGLAITFAQPVFKAFGTIEA